MRLLWGVDVQRRSPIRAWIGPEMANWYRIPDSNR
jgi:hypothetical protein